jgi:protocadherin Fat 4
MKFALVVLPLVLFFPTMEAYAWSFLTNSLDAPYNQCLTCHVSNSNLAMNAYGQDYLDPTHATRYHSKHNSDPGNCANCHSNKGYPVKRSGLDNLDSDGDAYTNLAEFSAGTFPGDAGDYPVDATAPVITAFSLPATSDSLTVTIGSFTASDNVSVTGYMLTETSVAPSPNAAGWNASAPAYYTFAAADISTLYAWAKDAAGNVSSPSSAQVDTTPSQQRINEPPVAFAGDDQIVIEGQTVILNAAGSTDDLGIITFAWVQLDGPGGAPIAPDNADAVVLSDAGSVTPVFVTTAVGINGTTLTFALTVTDGDGSQSTDEVSVSVDDNGISAFDGMQGVVSTLTADGDPIGVNAGAGNACVSLSTLTLQDIPASSSEPRDVLFGLVDFELKVTDPAASYITIHFPSAVPSGYKWLKYSTAGGWFDFSRDVISGGTGEGAVFNADRTQVTIYINDNSAYDDEPATGIIRDPGGLATGTGSAPASSAATGDSNSFGSSGGCFINTLSKTTGNIGPAPIFIGTLLLLWIIARLFRKSQL